MYCPHCGQQNPEEARFCGFCGAPLKNFRGNGSFPQMEEPAGPNSGENGMEDVRHKKRKGSRAVIAATAVVLTAAAVFCVVIALLWYRQRDDHMAEDAGNVQAEETQIPQEADQEDPEEAGWTNLKEYAEKELIPRLGSCGLGPFTCDYVMEDGSLGQDAVHDQEGVIVYSVRDFDGDGQEELLAAVLERDGTRSDMPDIQVNTVSLQMYEMTAKDVELKDEYLILNGVLGTADREDDWVFFRPSDDGIYILGSAWQFQGMCADGTYVSAAVLRYEGERFVEYAADTGIGSDFSDVDVSGLTDTLEEIGGFDETVQRMQKDHMAYFNDSSSEDVFFSIYGENPWLDDQEAADEARNQFRLTNDPAYLGEKTVEIYPGQRIYSQPVEESSRQEADVSSGQQQEEAGDSQGDSSYLDHLAALEQKEQEMEDSATDQASINRISGEIYEMWDDELNYVYQELKKTLTDEEFEVLKEEELEWIAYRDQQADAAAEEWAGGSGMPMAVNTALSEETKARVYLLANRWILGWHP